jgi:hypothetical protein
VSKLAWSATLALWCVEIVTLPPTPEPVRAPVPKAPRPPEKLTPEMIQGTHLYLWGGWPNGVISFNADGTYLAKHDPESQTLYGGTWCVSGDTVTIFEVCWHEEGEMPAEGHVRYDFKFDVAGYPKLVGKSNGTTDVALWNRR